MFLSGGFSSSGLLADWSDKAIRHIGGSDDMPIPDDGIGKVDAIVLFEQFDQVIDSCHDFWL